LTQKHVFEGKVFRNERKRGWLYITRVELLSKVVFEALKTLVNDILDSNVFLKLYNRFYREI
jgi:hypothetical protein